MITIFLMFVVSGFWTYVLWYNVLIAEQDALWETAYNLICAVSVTFIFLLTIFMLIKEVFEL